MYVLLLQKSVLGSFLVILSQYHTQPCPSTTHTHTLLCCFKVCLGLALTYLGSRHPQMPSCNHRSFISQGGLSAQAFVRVEVEDVNDNLPVFNPSTYVTSISGQTPPGTEVISVLASDRDSGMYGTVTYELIPGDLPSLFSIDSTTGM